MSLSQNQLQDFQKILEPTGKKYIFVTVSGAHLYGFDSVDSDLDLRGCHWPDVDESLKYQDSKDTFEVFLEPSQYFAEESDIVSHQVLKYMYLMAKQPNGYILEQLLSPLVVQTSEAHQELIQIGQMMISKEMRFHYGGFYRNQRKLFIGRNNKEIKYTLYQARILCTAVCLAKTGQLQPNLMLANEVAGLFSQEKVKELIQLKIKGENLNFVDESLKNYWFEELAKQEAEMESVFELSSLPNFNRALIQSEITKFIHRHLQLGWS
ncbi:MAG: nucleotidyltransferase domain-containing protein [Patescibacteria group bacterium]